MDRIEQVTKWFEEKIKIAEEIKDWKFQLICYYSLLDCFVQANDQYGSGSNKIKFTKFIIKFQESFDFLEKIDIVTLYYHFTDKFDNNPLDFMRDGCVYYPKAVLSEKKINSAYSNINKQKVKMHRYVELLYVLRNKITHELQSPIGVMDFESEVNEHELPFYSSCSIEGEDIWALTFPPKFIKKLVNEVVKNYFKECRKNGQDPFANNGLNRKMFRAWYEQ